MKNIMNRAHEIRKEAAEKWNCKTSEIVFSICLKMAWTEGEKKMDLNEIMEKIELTLPYERGEYWYSPSVNLWEKGNHKRVYINLKYGRSRKWTRCASVYVDLNTNKIIENRRDYSNANERGLVEQAAKKLIEMM